MEGLKPCPFCGSTRLHIGYFDNGTEGEIVCCHCGSSAVNRERWNQRAVDGGTSDGCHTFNELYHHRAVLFSKIVQFAGARAWKSKLHADGTMFDGYFIVGVETPEGQATYHYAIDQYWEMFDCKDVEYAPAWDGHTPQEAIARIERWNTRAETDQDRCNFERLVQIGESVVRKEPIRFLAGETYVPERACKIIGFSSAVRDNRGLIEYPPVWVLSCGHDASWWKPNYCPKCGARVVGD